MEEKNANSFFLTTTRWEVISEILDNAEHPSRPKNNGYYLTGPPGVGKTTLMYFLACIAHARGWILNYIPDTHLWVAGAGGPYHFLDRFAQLNELLADKDNVIRSLRTTSLPKWQQQRELELYLAEHTEKPVLYLIDNHEMLLQSQRPYFERFQSWGALRGNRVFYVYAGTSVSSEAIGQPGTAVLPFDYGQTKFFAEHSGLTDRIGKSARTLYLHYTGGMPGLLTKHVDGAKFKDAVYPAYTNSLKKAIGSMTDEQVESFHTFVENRFHKGFMGNVAPALLDTGIFYKINYSTHYASPIARRIVEHYWARSILKRRLDLEAEPEEHRVQLERAMLAVLAKYPPYLATVQNGPEGIRASPLLVVGIGDIYSLRDLEAADRLRPHSQVLRWEGKERSWDFAIVSFPSKFFAFVKIAGHNASGAETSAWIVDLFKSRSATRFVKGFGLSGLGKIVEGVPHMTIDGGWSFGFVVVTSQATASLTADAFPLPNVWVLAREGLEEQGVEWGSSSAERARPEHGVWRQHLLPDGSDS